MNCVTWNLKGTADYSAEYSVEYTVVINLTQKSVRIIMGGIDFSRFQTNEIIRKAIMDNTVHHLKLDHLASEFSHFYLMHIHIGCHYAVVLMHMSCSLCKWEYSIFFWNIEVNLLYSDNLWYHTAVMQC